jgi:hypothetical protein
VAFLDFESKDNSVKFLKSNLGDVGESEKISKNFLMDLIAIDFVAHSFVIFLRPLVVQSDVFISMRSDQVRNHRNQTRGKA